MKERPSTVVVVVQGTRVCGVIPLRRSASAVTVLKVEPGAYWPRVAVEVPSLPGPLAAARTWPSDGRIATTALGGPMSSSTASACS